MWIGYGCYIKAGVKIGTGVVIGANSVVTHDVEPYTIVAGAPAIPIRMRFSEETIAKLLESEWWNWSEEMLENFGDDFLTPEIFLSHYETLMK